MPEDCVPTHLPPFLFLQDIPLFGRMMREFGQRIADHFWGPTVMSQEQWEADALPLFVPHSREERAKTWSAPKLY